MEINSSPTDAFNRPLAEGDGVFLNVNGPVLFRCIRIETNPDPLGVRKLPPGTMQVFFVSMVPLLVSNKHPNPDIVRIGTVEDLGPIPYQTNVTTVTGPQGNA